MPQHNDISAEKLSILLKQRTPEWMGQENVVGLAESVGKHRSELIASLKTPDQELLAAKRSLDLTVG